jgi:hypothetical protein
LSEKNVDKRKDGSNDVGKDFDFGIGRFKRSAVMMAGGLAGQKSIG